MADQPPLYGALDRLTTALAGVLGELAPGGTDAVAVADALWLAAASTPGGAVPGAARPVPEPVAVRTARPAAAPDGPAPPDPDPEPVPPQEPAQESAHESGRPDTVEWYEPLPGPRRPATPTAPVTVAAVAAGRALPAPLDVGRALRPFHRRRGHGPRRVLDLPETLRQSARMGELLPVLGPVPEPWFEIVLVVDTAPAMAVWEDAVAEFTALLAGLGAFRRVTVLALADGERLVDRRGRSADPDRLAAPDGRRLVLMVSDCAAAPWYGPGPWRLLRRWGRRAPVALLNPLPGRLWSRTALDLPAVRVGSRAPVRDNRGLRYAGSAARPGWLPLPVLSFSPYALERWARGFVRGAPEGYDAVLVPPSGILPAALTAPEAEEPDPVEVFLRTGSADAVRLAALGSPFRRLDLALLHLIRREVVPGAGTDTVAELLTSGIVSVEREGTAPPSVLFGERARERLAAVLTRRDAWLTHTALSRYVASRTPWPVDGVNARVAGTGTVLPAEVRPFAEASGELLGLLRGSSPTVAARTAEARPISYDGPLPDPRRSRALLIGTTDYDFLAAHPGASHAVENLRAVLTSPDGWNLPPEHIRILVDPPDREAVLGALRKACEEATDALFLYAVGHVVTEAGAVAWGLKSAVSGGSSDAIVPLSTVRLVLESHHVRRVLAVLDHDRGLESLRLLAVPARPLKTQPSLRLLASTGQDVVPLGPVLAGIADRGVPGGPEFLGVHELREEAERWLNAGPRDEYVHSLELGSFPLALVRNSAVGEPSDGPDPTDPETDIVYEAVSTRLRRLLPLRYAGPSRRSTDRVLLELLQFAEAPPEGSDPANAGELLTALTAHLTARGLTVSSEKAGESVRHYFVRTTRRLTGHAHHLRVEGATGPWLPAPYEAIRYSSPRVRFLVVPDEPDHPFPPLADRVSVLDDDSVDGHYATVVLRVPLSPAARDGWPGMAEELLYELPMPFEDGLLAAVENACSSLAANGPDLARLGVPDSLEDPVLVAVRPDPESLDWQPHEEYDHGLVVGELTISAELEFEGFLPADETSVRDPDDDPRVWTRVHRDVVLVFTAQIEPDELGIELELQQAHEVGRSPREDHPHAGE